MHEVKKTYNAFSGVFLPTFLTIIGAIFYLRLGVVVGGSGILGAILIIIISVSVTVSTALSLSSITTNIKISAGGAYSIISKTLGLEVGGSVGIPLYLAQAVSVPFYIFAFAEGWKLFFPGHSTLFIAFSVFLLLFILTYIATNLAIRTQYIVFAFILLSLGFIFFGNGIWFTKGTLAPLIGNFETQSYWFYFALFFPAVTGLMAGVGLSGELSNPRQQIPKGTLIAIAITTFIYILGAIWLGFSATSDQLLSDPTIMIQLSAFGPFIILGLLSATFSSALTTFVAAPRLLQALGSHSLIPFSRFFAKLSKKGEPRMANLLTSFIVISVLLMGSLNVIAPVLTVLFLMAYFIINMAILIEQSLGLISFRPTFKIPKIIPLYGALSAVILIFFISWTVGLLATGSVLLILTILLKKKITPKEENIQSSLLYALSELLSKKISKIQKSSTHVWKPNILLPILSAKTLIRVYPLIKSILLPNGTLSVLGIRPKRGGTYPEKSLAGAVIEPDLSGLKTFVNKKNKEEIFAGYSEIAVKDYIEGVCTALGAVEGQMFPPNILFFPFDPNNIKKSSMKKVIETAEENKVSVVFFDRNKLIRSSMFQNINIWISQNVLKQGFDSERSFDLGMLLGYKLMIISDGQLHSWMCVTKNKKDRARTYLKKVLEEGRIPNKEIHISSESLISTIKKAPFESINIFSFSSNELETARKIAKESKKLFLFTFDSSKEDMLA